MAYTEEQWQEILAPYKARAKVAMEPANEIKREAWMRTGRRVPAADGKPEVIAYPELSVNNEWNAINDNYDGAEDSRSPVGYGKTEEEAIADLLFEMDEHDLVYGRA